MTTIDKANMKSMYALNRLPSCEQAIDECNFEQAMTHGADVKNPTDDLYAKKVIEYNQELNSELKARFQIDSVEYAIANGKPF